jgi:hypothetical protein
MMITVAGVQQEYMGRLDWIYDTIFRAFWDDAMMEHDSALALRFA